MTTTRVTDRLVNHSCGCGRSLEPWQIGNEVDRTEPNARRSRCYWWSSRCSRCAGCRSTCTIWWATWPRQPVLRDTTRPSSSSVTGWQCLPSAIIRSFTVGSIPTSATPFRPAAGSFYTRCAWRAGPSSTRSTSIRSTSTDSTIRRRWRAWRQRRPVMSSHWYRL